MPIFKRKLQVEIDFIQERGFSLCANEIKSTKNFTKTFIKNLTYFKKLSGKMWYPLSLFLMVVKKLIQKRQECLISEI